MEPVGFDYRGVKKTRPLAHKMAAGALLQPHPLPYLGAWIYALGTTPAAIVRAEVISEGYLSQLISGKKRNPSFAKVKAVADFLGVEVEVFQEAPPDEKILRQLRKFVARDHFPGEKA